MHVRIMRFLGDNRFALLTAIGWLATVWLLVVFAQIYFSQSISLAHWASSWDGGWYRSIIEQGYSAGLPTQQANVAFFPLFPLLVWLVTKLTNLPVVWAAMVISSLSFTAALVVLYRFVAKHFSVATAKWALLLMAFNPFSFYFGMMYTEGLFVLLVAATFWFIFDKRWWYAALVAGLATATRSVGIALSITVVAAWLAEGSKAGHFDFVLRSAQESAALKVGKRHRTKSKWPALMLFLFKTLGILVLSISGLIAFSAYLHVHTGDAFAYRTAQQFWPGRGGLSNIGNELGYLWAHNIINLEYAITLMWYGVAAAAFAGLLLLLRMRRYIMALFTAVALSLPLLFGTATSMNRYSQVVVPIFVAYAVALQDWPRWGRFSLLLLCAVGMALAIFLIIDPRHAFVG